MTMISSCANSQEPTDCDMAEKTRTTKTLNDRQQIEQVFRSMCDAMISKDTVTLAALHAADFVLTHMTGLRQTKREYIDAIVDGTLNYYSAEHENIDVSIDGDRATIVGRSRINAAVYGGGRHTWRLQSRLTLEKREDRWLIISSAASTY